MINIFKRLWSKKLVITSWVVIILAGYSIYLVSCEEIHEWFSLHTGRGEFFFHNVKEIDKDLMKKLCSYAYLEIEKIPESAEDIYIYYQPYPGGDRTLFCSMTLSTEEVTKFAESFIGLPISVFKFKKGIDWMDVKDDSVRHTIFELRRGEASAGIVKNWNLRNIKNVKYFEVIGKTKEEFIKLRMEIFGDSE